MPAALDLGIDVPRWLILAGGLALALAVAAVVRALLVRVIDRGDNDRHRGRQLGRLASLVVFLVLAFTVLETAGVQIGPALGALGVGGIAVAFAAQDILANLLAGLMIQVRRPFRIGDQIESQGFEGTVRDVDLRATRLHTFDGLDVVLPNAKVLADPIVNHTRTPLRRTTIAVGVAYDTDLGLATQVLERAVRQAPAVIAPPPPEVWVSEFADSAIVFSVRYWHSTTQRDLWEARHEVALAVKRALDRAGIVIPFPQRTLWFPPSTDSKPGDDRPAS
ncbi:MAG: mechanosensitive ion channel family protein [Austwickia sp.]|nr:mechanosensitive ion channel family protein [Actinomycetota bacterium]MCO5308389.1 mechanosensitive ion channel family protein [Austwickia sp.]